MHGQPAARRGSRSAAPPITRVRAVARERLGLEQLRPAQEEAILTPSGSSRSAARGHRCSSWTRRTAAEAARDREKRREQDSDRVELMRGYAETTGCCRAYILDYFGEPARESCGFCDNCDRRSALAPRLRAKEPEWKERSLVVHRDFGRGMVVRRERSQIAVLFDLVGEKKLALATLRRDPELLRPMNDEAGGAAVARPA